MKIQEIVGAMSNGAGPLTWYVLDDDETSIENKTPLTNEGKTHDKKGDFMDEEALEELAMAWFERIGYETAFGPNIAPAVPTKNGPNRRTSSCGGASKRLWAR